MKASLVAEIEKSRIAGGANLSEEDAKRIHKTLGDENAALKKAVIFMIFMLFFFLIINYYLFFFF